MDMGLKGKAALITGGSDGIGFAAAKMLAAEGVRVAICARREEHLRGAAETVRRATGGEVLAVAADIGKAEDAARFVSEAAKAFGRIDILVNNAGSSSTHPFEQVPDEEWQRDIDLKLMGAVRCSRAVLPYMRKVGGGRIVNVTAGAGKTPGAASVPTSVSRAAGLALTKAMSRDLGKDNILVNSVVIGVVHSAQWERRHAQIQKGNPSYTLEQFYADTVKARGVPLGREGTAEEAASVILFLASNMASFVTGVAINIDGGQCAVL
ncbi:MAG: SDR family NAD(P)-dependent oxidoreductase [Dehalococcoidia bacterium]|nr:SDR family NAD(P)-dependent oxidoreductase [Dehalococcoidia bacterium]